jgi:hypothetical protein
MQTPCGLKLAERFVLRSFKVLLLRPCSASADEKRSNFKSGHYLPGFSETALSIQVES